MSYHITPDIVPLLEADFPDKFKDEQSLLINFFESFFQWMEQTNNTLYFARNLLNYRDIDKTEQAFLYHFNKKYLPSIQLDTSLDTRLLIKHSLDFLRARGTARADKLFFAAVYGVEANVYLPSTDLFKLSSGDWVVPTYLEITHRDINPSFIGKEIIGVSSGAKAFVEDLIIRKLSQTSARYVELFFISAIEGNFKAGEILRIASNTNLVGCPTFLGSLNSLTVIDGSSNFNVGDIVSLTSDYGSDGTALVTALTQQTGIISFNLENPGYGYTSNAEIIISEQAIEFANMQFNGNISSPILDNLIQFIQPLNTIQYWYANGTFINGDILTTYSNTGNVIANGTVIRTVYANSTSGTLTVAPNYGNLAACTIYYTEGNTKSANLVSSGFTNISASGNVVGFSSNLVINVNNIFGTFQVGETVYQQNSSGFIIAAGIVDVYTISSSSGTINLTNCSSLFYSNISCYGQNSGSIATVNDITLIAGLYQINNNFNVYPENYVYETSTNSYGFCNTIYQGFGANLSISPTLGYPETITINDDFLYTANQSALLSSNDYGFPLSVINANTLLSALDYTNLTIGQLSSLTSINPGNSYTYPPFVRIYEPKVAIYNLENWILNISNTTGIFYVGEELTQNTTNMRGIVTFANSSTVNLQRLRFFDTWITNTTSNSYILNGSLSGTKAFLQSYNIDGNPLVLGNNAVITDNVTTSNSSVSKLKILDSGFGFVNNEVLTFTSNNGLNIGSAITNVNGIGYGQGYYRFNGGFLSSDKKLRDGVYYQEFSYDIKSSIPLNIYEDMLIKILHVAGTKYFGSVVQQSNCNFNLQISCAEVSQYTSLPYESYGTLDFSVTENNPLIGAIL